MTRSRFQIVFTLARKEFLHILRSPLAPVSALLFVLGLGIPFFFPGTNLSIASSAFTQYAMRMPLALALICPTITMGLWVDERKEGTDRILLSLPIDERELSLGKFFGAWGFFLLVLALTIPVTFFAPSEASRFILPGPGAILCAYLNAALAGAFGVSLGLFFSTRFAQAGVAYLLTATGLAFLSLTHLISAILPIPERLAAFLAGLSIYRRLAASPRGILDTRDLLFFLLPTALFTALSAASIRQASRGRGARSGLATGTPRGGRLGVRNGILTLIAIVVAVVGLVSPLRFDLTSERLYSLSPYTKEIVKSLPSEVAVTWYRSSEFPRLSVDSAYIESLLTEYRASSNGYFSFQVVDPSLPENEALV